MEGARPATAIVLLKLAAIYMLLNERSQLFYDALQNTAGRH